MGIQAVDGLEAGIRSAVEDIQTAADGLEAGTQIVVGGLEVGTHIARDQLSPPLSPVAVENVPISQTPLGLAVATSAEGA